MNRLDIVFDNPILTKHLRSRLRRGQVGPWVVIVLTISLAVTWVGFTMSTWLNLTSSLGILLGLQLLCLTAIGSQQIAGAVGGARASGIMEFHRLSPVPPSWLAIGYFLGAPIREYLLFACIMPFVAVCAILGHGGLLGWLQFEITLLLASWLLHAITLLSSLSTKKPKAPTKEGSVGGIILLFIFLGQPLGVGIWFAMRYLLDERPWIRFFGLPLPWLMFVTLYQLPVLAFLLVGSARKMRGERAHAYSKRLAIAGMGGFVVLLLGGFWSLKGYDYVVLGLLYGMVVGGSILSLAITPDRAEYVRGLRLAERHGQKRPSPWSDAGTNRSALFVLCTLVFLGATIAWEAIEGRPRVGARANYSLTIAIGVFVVAYFGLGYQYFRLRLARRGESLFQVFVFLIWLVPLLVGGILAATGAKPGTAQVVLSLSPLAGLAISTGVGEPTVAQPATFAALMPAITFAFVFNYLLVTVQRKIDLLVHSAEKSKVQIAADEVFAARS